MTMLFHLLLAIVSLGCTFFARRAGMSPGAALAMSAVFGAFAVWQVACGAFAVWQVACGVMAARGRSRAKPVLTLGGFSWSLNDFCRGWLVTGETGSGKTLSAINAMLWQVSKNCPRWGGKCDRTARLRIGSPRTRLITLRTRARLFWRRPRTCAMSPPCPNGKAPE
ncbi:DEAD/DEAH box helicase family protein [Termitidicoccus mucosus]|uniref:DEAD/DEAH box helicase family protein n=1 Tax=Termitidicoccus mucosus TaxID=1184151 RepID=UPI003183DE5D